MAATFETIDLMGPDLAHVRMRPRFASPVGPPPRAMERLPAAPLPTTAEMEAPVWRGVESAPPIRVEPLPPARKLALPVPVAVTLVPAAEPPSFEAPPRRPVEASPAVSTPPAPVAEPLFDELAESFFAEDPFLTQRPEGLPWWALAIPASAALGTVSMILTALVLFAAWT